MTPENTTNDTFFCTLKVIILSPLISVYSMNKFVTNKSKLPQDGAQVFPLRESHDRQSPHIWGDWLPCAPLRGSHDSQSPHIRT